MVPLDADDPMRAIGVMEEGEVDPSRPEEHRLAPRAFKRRRRHEIVLDVLVVPIDGADDRVGQPESSVAIAQAGGPHTSGVRHPTQVEVREGMTENRPVEDRKSTRLNSSHVAISYAVFCLKKKTKSATT